MTQPHAAIAVSSSMPSNAVDLSPALHRRLQQIRHVALDMDGTIYRGAQLFDFTPGFLQLLTDLGIGYTFLTNNSSKSVADYLKHLSKMGLSASPEQMFISTHATLAYLREQVPQARRLYVLGTKSMQLEMSEAGFEIVDETPDAVVVGFDTQLAYDRLCKAAYFVEQGLPYVASHPDRYCPTDLPTVLVDCGAICKAIEYATSRARTPSSASRTRG